MSHTTHILLWAWHAGLVYLTHTVPSHCRPLELAAVSKVMPTSKVSPFLVYLAA